MNTVESSLLCWGIVLIWGSILFIFKKFCLDKIKNGFIKYLFGITPMYAILIVIFIASERNINFRIILQNGRVWIIRGIPVSIILILIPAIYSIFLIGKGPFKESGKKAPWSWKLKMMASVFFNTWIALFGLLFISFFHEGYSFSKLVFTIKESLQYIEWGWMLVFAAACAFIVLVVWLDHKKHVQK